jgi:CDP-diglyceride synthetase
MNSFNAYWAIGGFFGGWCGSVPISLIIWWIIHHGGPPPPQPDPWWKISIAGAITGAIVAPILLSFTGEGLTSISVAASVVIGYAVGAIAGGIAGRASLPQR